MEDGSVMRDAWCVVRGWSCPDFRLKTWDFRPLHIHRVGPDGEQAKQGAEEAFALGHPCDGFDVQGMQGKESGDKGASPACASHSTEKPKQQEGVGDVKEQIDRVERAGAEAKEPDVEHEREPGERLPVTHAV